MTRLIRRIEDALFPAVLLLVIALRWLGADGDEARAEDQP